MKFSYLNKNKKTLFPPTLPTIIPQLNRQPIKKIHRLHITPSPTVSIDPDKTADNSV